MTFEYDVLVIGGGHAGCEAAHAAARMGAKTCLITMDMNKIAQMSCNPAVGGIAKGQIVREIDALGGKMGEVIDECSIQFRMLNCSKGPAMWSPRSQADRGKYIWAWRRILENLPNLSIWQDMVTEFIFEPQEDVSCGTTLRIAGAITQMDVVFKAKSVVLTVGTFLNGLMHIGRTMIPGGRVGEPASYGLTEQLKAMGFVADRMKTGTPVRLNGRTIDFSLAERQEGDADFHKFSYLPLADESKQLPSLPCWTIYTNEKVHEILRSGLPDSPLYNGQIQSIGPRYCPSIETKLVTFADKNQHMLFLEPEGTDTQEYYLNGFSSSLPIDVQLEALRHIPALAHVEAYRPGYAIEYDFFDPTQLRHTLETKLVSGLFFAGQVNGTTGYEEAAGQGLVAGVNAALKIRGVDEEFVLGRDEAYIGVLIDDLVTKGVDEPYRMFTSRAEYRILLRQDDADMRLTPRGYQLGLATEQRYQLLLEKQQLIEKVIQFCEEFHVKLSFNEVLAQLNSAPLKEGVKLISLVNRPELNMLLLANYVPELKDLFASLPANRRDEIIEAAEVRIKYAGYIEREKLVAEKINRLEKVRLSPSLDYNSLQQLTIEARQKLSRIRPENIGQASRIPGVSPADINILLVLMGR
ncbi:MAG: tRNA uridine-5-carboxymethylaminomethyl(34) synthesis enzyme MnmG [Bacteroidales bacterium]|nr:tRNA uridine-5-carboxymethylaminomethyl(34) synthesis enzyme MnmG [Bacteroidales bacterium]